LRFSPGSRPCSLIGAAEQTRVARLDDVYSDLRLNYETLKWLISLASLSVAKPTICETSWAAVPGFLHRHFR